METIQVLAKRIELARAARDAEYEDKLVVVYIGLGEQLERALQRYGDKIAEAAAANNVRLLRELHDGLCALRNCLEEWGGLLKSLASLPARTGSIAAGVVALLAPPPRLLRRVAMRRLLSPIGHRHLSTAGAHACRHACCPRCFFGFSPLPDPWGWGVAAVPPQPAFWR